MRRLLRLAFLVKYILRQVVIDGATGPKYIYFIILRTIVIKNIILEEVNFMMGNYKIFRMNIFRFDYCIFISVSLSLTVVYLIYTYFSPGTIIFKFSC